MSRFKFGDTSTLSIDTSHLLTRPQGDERYLNEPISEDVSMNNHKITELKSAENENEAVNKKQLDSKADISLLSNYARMENLQRYVTVDILSQYAKTSDLPSKTDLDLSSPTIINNINNVASVSPILVSLGGVFSMNTDNDSLDLDKYLDMKSHKIINVKPGTKNNDVVNVKQLNDLKDIVDFTISNKADKNQLDNYILKTNPISRLSNKVPSILNIANMLTSDDNFDLSSHKIINSAQATEDNDLVTFKQLNDALKLKADKSTNEGVTLKQVQDLLKLKADKTDLDNYSLKSSTSTTGQEKLIKTDKFPMSIPTDKESHILFEIPADKTYQTIHMEIKHIADEWHDISSPLAIKTLGTPRLFTRKIRKSANYPNLGYMQHVRLRFAPPNSDYLDTLTGDYKLNE